MTKFSQSRFDEEIYGIRAGMENSQELGSRCGYRLFAGVQYLEILSF
jgi:hypothetical protein